MPLASSAASTKAPVSVETEPGEGRVRWRQSAGRGGLGTCSPLRTLSTATKVPAATAQQAVTAAHPVPGASKRSRPLEWRSERPRAMCTMRAGVRARSWASGDDFRLV